MPQKIAAAVVDVEVKPLHRDAERRAEAVKKLHQLSKCVAAKAGVGRAFKAAIGDEADKAFGHEGLVSGLKSGEKVPDYLASIYADPAARRRFALALLEDDEGVELETIVRIRRTA